MDDLYYYEIELRDPEGELYKTIDGRKLVARSFSFTDKTKKEFVHIVCKKTAENYKAVCKDGTLITIEVRYKDGISGAYPILYTFIEKENRFIIHT